jgi:hypothetical protein
MNVRGVLNQMNKAQKQLIELLASALKGDTIPTPELSVTEWYLLCKEAKEHGVHLLLTYFLKNQNIILGDENLNQACAELMFITALFHASSVSIIEDFLNKIEKKGIEIMLLKGIYFKSLYPNPALRVMGDVDFYVKKEDLNEIFIVLDEIGYKRFDQNNFDLHYVYIHPNYITIEIHYSLMTSIFSKSQKTFEHLIWNERVVKNIDGRSYTVPSEVNHAIFCFIHMMKHLRSSGFGLRQLCDLVFLIKDNQAFDWDELFEKARRFNIYNFVVSILWICNVYFKLEVPEIYLSNIDPKDHDKYHVLLEDILKSGEFGSKDKRYLVNKKLAEYGLDTNSCGNNPIHFIFPSRHKLSHVYDYVKKYPYLLPFAWIHRIINNVTRSDLLLREKLPNAKIISQHKELVKWLSKE